MSYTVYCDNCGGIVKSNSHYVEQPPVSNNYSITLQNGLRMNQLDIEVKGYTFNEGTSMLSRFLVRIKDKANLHICRKCILSALQKAL